METFKTEIETMEGDKLTLNVRKGALYLDVPLKEILGYEWCKILKRMIPVHAIERFKLKANYWIGEYPDDVREELYFRSTGYTDQTKKKKKFFEEL